jgi:PAS domain S-box-containing protein
METASVALASDPAGLVPLPFDNQTIERRALQQQALLAFGRRTNAQPSLAVLLQDAAELVGDVLHAQLAAVGEVRGNRLVLNFVARNEKGRRAAGQEHSCSLEDTDSMAVFALKSGNVTLAADLRKETRFRDDYLLGRGVRAALTAPLHANAKPFGVLCVYAREPREFSVDDVTFAETVAHLLSASLARIKAEQKLQESQEIRSSLLGMVDSMVMTLDMEGRVVEMNRACEELTRFRLDDVRDKPFWQAMVAPEDVDLVKVIFQSFRGSQIPSEFEGEVVARDGSRRRVSWSLKVLSTGQVQTILVTGRDRTAQAELKAELQRVRALTEETTATLTQLTARLDGPRSAAAPQISAPQTKLAIPSPPDTADDLDPADAGSEQRRSPRRAYRYRQGIAPMNGPHLPSPERFFEVDFWDISSCGFSFFVDELPAFEMLVAALGRGTSLTHFSARVMRVARITQDNSTRYLVGCDFINRVHLPKTR